MSASQKNRDGLDPEETVSENAKKVQKVKFTKTTTTTIQGKRFTSNISVIGTQPVNNSVVVYVKGHVKWRCSGKSGDADPPVLLLYEESPGRKPHKIILGNYDYPKNPSEEFVTLPINYKHNAEDISGQWYFYV